jgi:hypothetical protein
MRGIYYYCNPSKHLTMTPNIIIKDGELVLAKNDYYKLKELKSLDELLKVVNALQLSFKIDIVEKYNLQDIINIENK